MQSFKTGWRLALAVLMLSLATKIAAAPTAVQVAREMADAVAPSLPMRINQNLTMHTVIAGGNTVTFTAFFSYTKEQLKETLAQSGKTDAEAQTMMRKAAKGAVCAQGPEGRAFIAMGGRVRYLYRFVDGAPYESIEISSCS